MAKATASPARFKLPARIRSKRTTTDNFGARLALVDRIADLPGIETVERNENTTPFRVAVYLQRETSTGKLTQKTSRLLCDLDRDGITVSGLDRWARYQVLANGWGNLIDDRVIVHLPRDAKEAEIVWSIVRRAYDRLIGPVTPEMGSLVVSTWDWPRFSRTSLQ